MLGVENSKRKNSILTKDGKKFPFLGVSVLTFQYRLLLFQELASAIHWSQKLQLSSFYHWEKYATFYNTKSVMNTSKHVSKDSIERTKKLTLTITVSSSRYVILYVYKPVPVLSVNRSSSRAIKFSFFTGKRLKKNRVIYWGTVTFGGSSRSKLNNCATDISERKQVR